MAELSRTFDWLAKPNVSSTVYSPIPIRRFTHHSQLSLLKTFSVTDIPQQDSFITSKRPFKSFIETVKRSSTSPTCSQTFEKSLEQRLDTEDTDNVDLLEDGGFFEEVLPPTRTGNPIIYDKEFLKMDHSRSRRTLGVIKRGRNQYDFGGQEP